MPPDNALLIRAAAREGGELGVEDARVLFAAMLAGEVAPRELGAILAAWRRRRASLAEMTGFMRALDAHAGRLEKPHEGPRPVVLAGLSRDTAAGQSDGAGRAAVAALRNSRAGARARRARDAVAGAATTQCRARAG